jgi:hypothetical protein
MQEISDEEYETRFGKCRRDRKERRSEDKGLAV